MILQLNPSIPVEIKGGDIFPTGSAEAIGWIDYGKEDHLMWIVLMTDTGEPWVVPNPYVRACRNLSVERPLGFKQKLTGQSTSDKV